MQLASVFTLAASLAAAPAPSPQRAPQTPQARYRVGLPPPPDQRVALAWRARDERLTRGLLATGVVAGASTVLFLLSLVYLGTYRPAPGCCIDGYGGVLPVMITGPLTFVGVVGLSGVAIARRVHRRSRPPEIQLGATALSLRF